MTDRFDPAVADRRWQQRWEEAQSFRADSDSAKVQAAGSEVTALPASVAEQIDAMWAESVAPATGHRDFDSLARAVEGARGEPYSPPG